MQLNYERQGEGAPVILIHGLFGDLDNLKSISRSLSDDYTVINLDVRNHGQSPHSDSMTYDEMAADVIAVADAEGLDEFHLLGHSMGGKIAMEIALRHPSRVRSLIVADIAPVAYDARHSTILDALSALDVSQINSRQEADKALAERIESQGVRQFLLKNLRKQEDTWGWRMNLAALQDNYAQLIGAPTADGQYTGPVLFIRGELSDYVTEDHRDAIGSRFPNARPFTIANTGHWLHAEKPQAFNQRVRDFLAKH
ncbi:alpha/beta fold hydrolase [Aliidiomarina maris]|uniref:Alpha/beta hydrolase n=1 Tax=Aliidiomarina maris TaxID=531312 RepID=A0A327WX22_9GAMM|nr:alpha/beta fold hydrolase [Aliidiomarina maris]RAJ96470.1 esterase [Aliidiomarina maris]RUO23777.1 alpha/beta hydrolase [Aliidiomarina maris]